MTTIESFRNTQSSKATFADEAEERMRRSDESSDVDDILFSRNGRRGQEGLGESETETSQPRNLRGSLYEERNFWPRGALPLLGERSRYDECRPRRIKLLSAALGTGCNVFDLLSEARTFSS